MVTADQNGNLATDGGEIFNKLKENTEGVAMALAMAGAVPYLTHEERVAFSGSWGTFEGSNSAAFGTRVKIVDHFSLAGGVGFGVEEGTIGGTVSARVAF